MNKTTTDIATIIETNPVAVLIDTKTYTDFFQHIKAEVESFEPDVSTATGRKQIASLAYKVIRTKTAIDAAGKKLNESARAQISKVDEQRRIIRAELDELAAQARDPLTKWEEAEEQRISYCQSIIRHIEDCGNGFIGGQPQAYGVLIYELENKVVIDSSLGEFEEAARATRDRVLANLKSAFEAHQKAEADRMELERLRQQEAERQRAAREAELKAQAERLAKEAAEREAAEAKRREEEAAERARIEAQRLAEEAIARAEREKQEAIQKAEAERLALIREQERKEAARQAEIDREAAEQAKREANKRHRAKLTREAIAAICQEGIDQNYASNIVTAIIEGKIPHIKMEF